MFAAHRHKGFVVRKARAQGRIACPHGGQKPAPRTKVAARSVYRWAPKHERKRERIFSNVDSDELSRGDPYSSTSTAAAASPAAPEASEAATPQQPSNAPETVHAESRPASEQSTSSYAASGPPDWQDERQTGWDNDELRRYRDSGWGEVERLGDWGEAPQSRPVTSGWAEDDAPDAEEAGPQYSTAADGGGSEADGSSSGGYSRLGGGQQGGASPSGSPPWYDEGDDLGDYYPSDITVLSQREQEEILPVLPTGQQAAFYQPKTVAERTVQIAGSLAGVAVLSKSAALAVPALLYPVWGPWVRAGVRNAELLARGMRYVGLWRAQVLRLDVLQPFGAYDYPRGGGMVESSVRLLLGDPWRGGARSELVFPYQTGVEEVAAGEPAELLVLSGDPDFGSFKVVREVYLPQAGLWLSEYPFTNRDLFLDISLDIERSRQAAAAQQAPGQGQVHGGGSGNGYGHYGDGYGQQEAYGNGGYTQGGYRQGGYDGAGVAGSSGRQF